MGLDEGVDGRRKLNQQRVRVPILSDFAEREQRYTLHLGIVTSRKAELPILNAYSIRIRSHPLSGILQRKSQELLAKDTHPVSWKFSVAPRFHVPANRTYAAHTWRLFDVVLSPASSQR